MRRSDVLEAIYKLIRKNPTGFTSGELAEVLGVSRQSAHARLAAFVAEGLITRAGEGRGTLYRAAPYTPAHPNYQAPRPLAGDVTRVINTIPSTTAEWWPSGAVPTGTSAITEWIEQEKSPRKK